MITLAQFQGSEISPGVIARLYGWVYKTVRFSPLVIDNKMRTTTPYIVLV